MTGLTCPELVDGSNASTCGDLVVDTPADPDTWETDSECNWSGSGTDANGEVYRPNKRLYMAYTPPSCMTVFTDGQTTRMHATIEGVPSVSSTVVPCNGNCQPVLELTSYVSGSTYSGSSVVLGDYDLIESSSTISSSLDVNLAYVAEKRVLLSPGFRMYRNTTGHIFRATVGPCRLSPSAQLRLDPQRLASDKLLTLALSPMPAENVLNVELSESISSCFVSIQDQLGREMKGSYYDGQFDKRTMDISELLPGSYFVSIVGSNGAGETVQSTASPLIVTK